MHSSRAILRKLALALMLAQAPLNGLSMVCEEATSQAEETAPSDDQSQADDCETMCATRPHTTRDEGTRCFVYSDPCKSSIVVGVFGLGAHLHDAALSPLTPAGPCHSEPRVLYLNPSLARTTPPPEV